MTLEEFKKMISATTEKAHIFVCNSIGKAERIKSISLRMDDDGTLSVLCHTDHMRGRISTDEAKANLAAMQSLRKLYKQEPALEGSMDDFNGFFVHWDVVTKAIEASGHVGESPLDAIADLISERDELQEKVLSLETT